MRRKTNGLVLCGALLASAAIGCQKDEPVGPGLPITVMTYNLYLGTDITPLATIMSPEEVPAVAAMLWANIQASNFPERAKVLADKIMAGSPDLVALQEVTLYRRQDPSDYQPGDDVPNATEVVLDFLDVLMAELAARGGDYVVVGESPNVDAELPVADSNTGGLIDLRLTDRDVILARAAVQTANFVALPFDAKFTFMAGGAGGVPISLTRSTSRADVAVGDAHFTFGTAHLEIQSIQPVQTAQAQELLAGIASVPDPVLLLGDFNSEPGMNSYPLLTGAFRDGYLHAGGHDPGGFTCCNAGDLMNADPSPTDRIDLVLFRGRFRVSDLTIVGSDPTTDKTPDGLWASDHFGVLSHLDLVP
jgi:endonuclease/exonuclease/phosphatase family metal-dependent hydrolase